ncbi:P2 family phage major capsid protein [Escherichia coli]|uniref:P2 family phage major capsid protein n=1 Tax=Escherichia coli TaxID=562 RepID=UPI0033062D45
MFKLITEFTNESFALDILRIGFNGKSFAENTNPATNPNGEDVNKGWHQLAKEYDGGSHVLTTAVSVGAGGDYKTLDAAAHDVIMMLPAQFREHPQLTVLAGSDLVAAEQQRMFDQTDKPTEKAASVPMLKSIAGRRHVTPPFFPGKRLAVTIPKNLHVYTQTGTQRREAVHVSDRKAFESSWWRMQGYALEIPALYAAIDETAVTIK